MSIHFWKYVVQRYTYLNWRLCVPLWTCMGLEWLGFSEWLGSKGMWYGLVVFDGARVFLSCCILVGLFLGIYGLWKVARYNKRMMRERYEREIRELREYHQRLRGVQ